LSSPLVFLPGWCLGRGPWQPTVDALGGRIADLPGYRGAPLLDDFDAAAGALAASLAPGTILCGWSLGAMLALAAAARAPDKVAKLVLVGGTASFVQREGWPHAMPPAVLAEFAAAIAADPAAMLPRFVGGFNRGDARAKPVTHELLELADPLPPAATLAAGLAWLRDVDLRTVTPAVRTPTLILHGDHDPLMPLPAAEALAALLPAARLDAFADCAHAPFISDPATFRQRLAAFVDEPAAGPPQGGHAPAWRERA
jgi:pimeloyl-[acyl-carrier protein] methyl ester esterase